MSNKALKLFFILILISFFTSIKSRSASFKTKRINILMPAPFAESTKPLVDDFNKKEKGLIKLRVTKGPLETEAVSDLAISSLLLGKSPFDVILIDVTWLPKYAAAGWLEPMDKWINTENWHSLANGARLGNTYNNQIYRWPLVADMGLLYWRTDLLEKPPKTPEELIEVSLNLKRKGLITYGYVWQGRQYEGLSCVFLEVLNAFGGEWLSKESKQINLKSKESNNAAKWLKELITSGASPSSVTNFSETESLQAFETGQAALMRNWPYAWAELQKETSLVKGKVGVTTMVSKNGISPTATLGSWGFSILKSSSNKDAAYKAIEFLTSVESQKKLFLINGYTPTKKIVFKDKELKRTAPLITVLEKALSISKPRPQTPLYAQISNVLQTQLSTILTNQITPEKGMALAHEKSQKIISSASIKR